MINDDHSDDDDLNDLSIFLFNADAIGITIFPLNILTAICKVILIFSELSDSRPYYNNEIKFVRTLWSTVCKFGHVFRIRVSRNR